MVFTEGQYEYLQLLAEASKVSIEWVVEGGHAEAVTEGIGLTKGPATKAQKCEFCDRAATMSLIWKNGAAHVPVCPAHYAEGRNKISMKGGSVCDEKRVEVGSVPTLAYAEHRFNQNARMAQALQPALAFVEESDPGTYFGRQAGSERVWSAFQEAPEDTTHRAPIGRRGTPRGAVHTQHTGPNIQGVTGAPIKRVSIGKKGRGTRGYTRKVLKPDGEKQEIPDSLLQMLGTDWKTLRASRVHDNRMTLNIDGVRFSVYTRRG